MPTRTELVWDGKYDGTGKRVAPLRVALPFQTVETVNESAQDRQRSLFQALEQEKPWRNRLSWGDKKYVLPSLLPEFAIHTTRKRLLQIPDVRPFVVQNLGKYERQLWLADHALALAAGNAVERHRAYVAFLLQLYHATPLHGYTWLHGTKGGRLVHVGSVEAPVSGGDVKNIAVEFKKAIGTGPNAPKTNGVDVLGWDFAFELNEVASQQAAAANIRMTFKRIPRDVMDKRAVEQGDVHFFELAALAVEPKVKGKDCSLTLTEFVIPPDDVPEEVRTAVKHWSQWIDYWAVDWDHKSDTFHNQWQTFRTRKDGKLALTATYTYTEPGDYRVVVKVIDILGNDTTKTVKVKVGPFGVR